MSPGVNAIYMRLIQLDEFVIGFIVKSRKKSRFKGIDAKCDSSAQNQSQVAKFGFKILSQKHMRGIFFQSIHYYKF